MFGSTGRNHGSFQVKSTLIFLPDPSFTSFLPDLSFTSQVGLGGVCCPLVFNPYTLMALIAGIALATYFLRFALFNVGDRWAP